VKRHFNYTDRKRIPRERVQIVLKERGGGPPTFDAVLDLSEMNLPDAGRVFIEAYYRASYMRFDFGTVGKIGSEEDRALRDIDNREHIQFRIKIVDLTEEQGKLLAEVDRIAPTPADGPAERISILAVKLEDLGNQAWGLDLTDTSIPTLVLNREIGSKEYVRSNETFFALVFPAVVREILTQVLIIEAEQEYEPDGSSDSWQERWLYFVCSMPSVDPLPPTDAELMEKAQWIDHALRVFCDSHQACRSFLDFHRKEDAP
jgi:hypothetical protein